MPLRRECGFTAWRTFHREISSSGLDTTARAPPSTLKRGTRTRWSSSMAISLAAAINCHNRPADTFAQGCGTCNSCRKIFSNIHPDLITVEPEGKVLKYIKIAQIRELQKSISTKPYEAKERVLILLDAHAMTEEAANALLGFTAWMSIRPDGPLWSRNFENWTEEEGIKQIAAIREAYGPVRFVVGHSPTSDHRIHVRFDNSVFLIDTGMSKSYYGGHPSALEIKDGVVAAIYMFGQC